MSTAASRRPLAPRVYLSNTYPVQVRYYTWYKLLVAKLHQLCRSARDPVQTVSKPAKAVKASLDAWENAFKVQFSQQWVTLLDEQQLEDIYVELYTLAEYLFALNVRRLRRETGVATVGVVIKETLAVTPDSLRQYLNKTKNCKLPHFLKKEPKQVPLSDIGLTYKSKDRGDYDALLRPAYVLLLVSSLVEAWLLGHKPADKIFKSKPETALSEWHKAMTHKFSKAYFKQLSPQQNELIHALHYNLSLGLFDHVKIEILKTSQKEAIENLCQVWTPAAVEKNAREKLRDGYLAVDVPELLQHLLPETYRPAAHSLASGQPRIARRIAKKVYGMDWRRWEQERRSRGSLI